MIFIIGSLSNYEEIERATDYYTELGYLVAHIKKQPGVSLEELIEEVFYHIKESRKIIVVPKKDGSIGEGTMYEMMFAKFLEKNIKIWNAEENHNIK